MTSTNIDGAFVDEVDIDQGVLQHTYILSPRASNEPRAASPEVVRDNENAPLLSRTSDDYGSANGDGSGDSDRNGHGANVWYGMAEFQRLPWWKRPSVRAQTPRRKFFFG